MLIIRIGAYENAINESDVPVVTLYGDRHAGRMAATTARTAGLPGLGGVDEGGVLRHRPSGGAIT